MHKTQSRLPVNDNDVVTSIATIGTFEAVVFFFFHEIEQVCKHDLDMAFTFTLQAADTTLCRQPHMSKALI